MGLVAWLLNALYPLRWCLGYSFQMRKMREEMNSLKVKLPGAENAESPVLSPDSESILFLFIIITVVFIVVGIFFSRVVVCFETGCRISLAVLKFTA